MEQSGNEVFVSIMHIEQYCRLKVIGKDDMAEQYVPVITGKLNEIIPKLIKARSEREDTDYVDPAMWAMMLKRIIDAMGTDDDFIKIDAFEDIAELLKYYHSCLETGNE